MKIRMICGTYGYRGRNGIMEVKNKKSTPFEVEEEEGKRLIQMEYAVEVSSGAVEQDEEEETEHEESGGLMEELENMSKKELEKVAKDMGLSTAGTKQDLIQRIFQSETGGGEEPEGGIKLNAAEPEE